MCRLNKIIFHNVLFPFKFLFHGFGPISSFPSRSLSAWCENQIKEKQKKKSEQQSLCLKDGGVGKGREQTTVLQVQKATQCHRPHFMRHSASMALILWYKYRLMSGRLSLTDVNIMKTVSDD